MQQELVQLGNGAHALAIQFLGNADDAADAVHDAFAKALRKPDAYDAHKGPLKPWFLHVVRNRCIDLIRRRRPGDVDVEQLSDRSSITYRIAVGPQQGRKVFTLQTLPDCRPDNPFVDTVGKVAGFTLHAGVATRAHERDQLERLCRHITRPAVSTKRLSLTRHGKVRYELKTP